MKKLGSPDKCCCTPTCSPCALPDSNLSLTLTYYNQNWTINEGEELASITVPLTLNTAVHSAVSALPRGPDSADGRVWVSSCITLWGSRNSNVSGVQGGPCNKGHGSFNTYFSFIFELFCDTAGVMRLIQYPYTQYDDAVLCFKPLPRCVYPSPYGFRTAGAVSDQYDGSWDTAPGFDTHGNFISSSAPWMVGPLAGATCDPLLISWKLNPAIFKYAPFNTMTVFKP